MQVNEEKNTKLCLHTYVFIYKKGIKINQSYVNK